MVVILLCFLGGIGLGYLGRNRNRLSNIVSRLADIMLCFLLLFLGLSIGVNDVIMSKLYDLGIDASNTSRRGDTGKYRVNVSH